MQSKVKGSHNAKGFLSSQFQPFPGYSSCSRRHVNFAYRCKGFGTILGCISSYSSHMLCKCSKSIAAIGTRPAFYTAYLANNTLFIKSLHTIEYSEPPLNPDPICPQRNNSKLQYLSRLPGLERHILPWRLRVLTPGIIATNQSVLPEARSEPLITQLEQRSI